MLFRNPKSLKSSAHFILMAHFGPGQPYFKFPIVTCG